MRLILSLFIFINSPILMAKQLKINNVAENKALEKYMNSFKNLAEVFENLVQFGIITIGDKDEIVKFLVKENVDVKANLPPVKAVGDKLLVGKASGFVLDTAYDIRTLEGELIKVPKGMSVAETFEYIYRKQTRAKSTAFLELFISVAHAVRNDEIALEGAKASLADMVARFGKIYSGLSSFFKSDAAATDGVDNGVTATHLWPVREFLSKGSVFCQGKDFQIAGIYPSNEWLEVFRIFSLKSLEEPKKSCASGRLSKDEGRSTNFCKLISATLVFKDSVDLQKDIFYIKNEKAQKFLGESRPRCNKENAKKVKNAMISEIQTILEEKPKVGLDKSIQPGTD
ncbi:MAG: hypothetical protein SGJ18_15785 [Pseudomonadota bacterium]|nr:hypothetical protein [Pseudomonadota bacterium]